MTTQFRRSKPSRALAMDTSDVLTIVVSRAERNMARSNLHGIHRSGAAGAGCRQATYPNIKTYSRQPVM